MKASSPKGWVVEIKTCPADGEPEVTKVGNAPRLYPTERPARANPSLLSVTGLAAMFEFSRTRSPPPGRTVMAPEPKGVPERALEAIMLGACPCTPPWISVPPE